MTIKRSDDLHEYTNKRTRASLCADPVGDVNKVSAPPQRDSVIAGHDKLVDLLANEVYEKLGLVLETFLTPTIMENPIIQDDAGRQLGLMGYEGGVFFYGGILSVTRSTDGALRLNTNIHINIGKTRGVFRPTLHRKGPITIEGLYILSQQPYIVDLHENGEYRGYVSVVATILEEVTRIPSPEIHYINLYAYPPNGNVDLIAKRPIVLILEDLNTTELIPFDRTLTAPSNEDVEPQYVDVAPLYTNNLVLTHIDVYINFKRSFIVPLNDTVDRDGLIYNYIPCIHFPVPSLEPWHWRAATPVASRYASDYMNLVSKKVVLSYMSNDVEVHRAGFSLADLINQRSTTFYEDIYRYQSIEDIRIVGRALLDRYLANIHWDMNAQGIPYSGKMDLINVPLRSGPSLQRTSHVISISRFSPMSCFIKNACSAEYYIQFLVMDNLAKETDFWKFVSNEIVESEPPIYLLFRVWTDPMMPSEPQNSTIPEYSPVGEPDFETIILVLNTSVEISKTYTCPMNTKLINVELSVFLMTKSKYRITNGNLRLHSIAKGDLLIEKYVTCIDPLMDDERGLVEFHRIFGLSRNNNKPTLLYNIYEYKKMTSGVNTNYNVMLKPRIKHGVRAAQIQVAVMDVKLPRSCVLPNRHGVIWCELAISVYFGESCIGRVSQCSYELNCTHAELVDGIGINYRYIFCLSLPINIVHPTRYVLEKDPENEDYMFFDEQWEDGYDLQAYANIYSYTLLGGTEELARIHLRDLSHLNRQWRQSTEDRLSVPIDGRQQKNGSVTGIITMVTTREAHKNPAGKGQDEPNRNPYIPPIKENVKKDNVIPPITPYKPWEYVTGLETNNPWSRAKLCLSKNIRKIKSKIRNYWVIFILIVLVPIGIWIGSRILDILGPIVSVHLYIYEKSTTFLTILLGTELLGFIYCAVKFIYRRRSPIADMSTTYETA